MSDDAQVRDRLVAPADEVGSFNEGEVSAELRRKNLLIGSTPRRGQTREVMSTDMDR